MLEPASCCVAVLVMRVCGHRTLCTLILAVEHVRYLPVVATWNMTGKTVSDTLLLLLLFCSSTDDDALYCRMAQVTCMVPPSSSSSHLQPMSEVVFP